MWVMASKEELKGVNTGAVLLQACNGAETGIVATQLGPDSKPMYAPIHGAKYTM